MVHIIIKEGKPRYESEESKLYKKIQNGSANDSDISKALNIGDRKILQMMNSKVDELYKEKRTLDDKYGKDVWDGKDEKGNLYKNIDFNISHNK